MSWSELTTFGNIPSLGSTRMVYDEAINRIVLFGGSPTADPSTAIDTTWVFDGASQTLEPRHPTTSPPSLTSEGLAYDRLRQKVVLFGGDRGGTPYAQTWTYDGTVWTQLGPTNCPTSDHPAARISPGMEWDGEKIVLYGGQDSETGENFFDDTWYLAPDQEGDLCWSQASLPVNPGKRSRHRMAYNDFLDEIVLFGGAIQQVPGASVLVNDTWFFRPGIGWGQCGTIPGHPCGTPPVSRCCVGLGFADAGGRTVLFGGGTAGLYQYNDTWTWDVASGWVCRSMQNCNMPG